MPFIAIIMVSSFFNSRVMEPNSGSKLKKSCSDSLTRSTLLTHYVINLQVTLLNFYYAILTRTNMPCKKNVH